MGKYKQSHANARRAEATYEVCLRGDLNADWQAANRALERAQNEARSSSSKEDPGLEPLVERVRALEAEMLEHTETWRLRALPRHKFHELVAAYPPRTGDDGEPLDKDRLGVNRDEFFPALIRASVVEPELDDDDWAWLLGDDEDPDSGVFNDRQIADLNDVAWFLNRGEVTVPFSHAASLATRDTDSE